MRKMPAILAGFLLMVDASPFAAQTANKPAAIKAVETPWTVSCQSVTADGKISCEMTKQLQTTEPASFIAQISVLTGTEGTQMRIIAPHQLAIANGLTFSVDDIVAGQRAFTTSVPSGIVALFVLDEALLAAARSGTRMKVSAKTRTGQDFSFTISLGGFSAALDKLLR
jgi:invasion protein IalB